MEILVFILRVLASILVVALFIRMYMIVANKTGEDLGIANWLIKLWRKITSK